VIVSDEKPNLAPSRTGLSGSLAWLDFALRRHQPVEVDAGTANVSCTPLFLNNFTSTFLPLLHRHHYYKRTVTFASTSWPTGISKVK
jgi:hypothetical protein